MKQPLSGVDFSAEEFSEDWKKSAELWVEYIQRICANFDYSDAPWEYLERTNSAIFAGALSASGLPAMPEAYVNRNDEKRDQRVDICIVNNDFIELVEFKLAQVNLGRQQATKIIESQIRRAITQVNNITSLFGSQIGASGLQAERIGAVIGLPFLEAGTPEKEIEKAVQEVITQIRSTSYPIKAWVFPEKYLKRPSNRYANNYYPGTFLVQKKHNKSLQPTPASLPLCRVG